jgi:hypothetical protein
MEINSHNLVLPFNGGPGVIKYYYHFILLSIEIYNNINEIHYIGIYYIGIHHISIHYNEKLNS